LLRGKFDVLETQYMQKLTLKGKGELGRLGAVFAPILKIWYNYSGRPKIMNILW